MAESKKRVIIVGGGASGLSCCKWCLSEHLSPVVLEQEDGIGGLWKYNPDPNSHSSCYRSLETNTPKRLTQFSDFQMSEQYPKFPRHDQMLEYLQNYCDEFDLMSYVRLGCRVISVDKSEGLWHVRYETIENKEKVQKVEVGDALAICSGHHWDPMVVLPDALAFKGITLHSHHYRTSEPFHGKRVLIIGGGVSAREISKDIGKHCTCVMSTHQTAVFDSTPYRTVYPPVKSIDGNGATFEDDIYEEFDAIIYCTGYNITINYLDPSYIQRIENHPQTIALYRRCVSLLDPTLAFIGFLTTYGSIHPLAESQCLYFAQVLSGKIQLPSMDQMIKEVEEWKVDVCTRLNYRPMNVDFYTYLNYMFEGTKRKRKRQKKKKPNIRLNINFRR